jgi:acetyl esterase
MNIGDPEVEALLARLTDLGLRPYSQTGLSFARLAIDAAAWMQRDRPEVAEVRELLVDGADGRLPARLYHPEPGRRLPVVVYLHGGGWVGGSLRIADNPCRELARASGCPVVSVGYRLAPETPFPGGLRDCVAALAWVGAHGDDLGVDTDRLAVAGSSAGGNLAAATAIAARDLGGPLIRRQFLIYPVLAPPPGNPFPSYVENAEGFMMTRADLEWFWAHYVLDEKAGGPGLTAAPLEVEDLSGLPPATVLTAGLDPLRDEGRAYVDRLIAAGGEAELIEVPDMLHGFSWMTGELVRARDVVDAAAADLGERMRT